MNIFEKFLLQVLLLILGFPVGEPSVLSGKTDCGPRAFCVPKVINNTLQ